MVLDYKFNLPNSSFPNKQRGISSEVCNKVYGYITTSIESPFEMQKKKRDGTKNFIILSGCDFLWNRT